MRRSAALVCLLLFASVARGDGGRLQMRKQAGPFVISLFSNPETLAVGNADLSVLVEEQGSGRVLPDADVSLRLTPADPRSGSPIVVRLAHGNATNRLLSDAVVRMPQAGTWHAILRVSEGGQVVEAATDLIVANHSARRGTIWLFALAPLCVIGTFVWVEALKRGARQERSLLRA